MEKKLIDKQIFWMSKSSPITWNDIKHIEFQDDDIIGISDDDDDYNYYVSIMRKVLETDEEFEKRKEAARKSREILKKNRYNLYLKLKEEFEK